MRGITLFSLFNVALKHMLAIILAAVIFAVGAYAYCTYVAVPRYSATGSLLITNGNVDKNSIDPETGEYVGFENTDVVASLNFMQSAIKLLNQNDIFMQMSRLNGRYSYSQLKGMASIERSDDKSLFVEIKFTANSKETAVSLVNEYISIAPEYVKSKVGGSVSCFYASSASKVYPQTSVTIVLFAVLGALVVYSLFLIAFLFNTTIVHDEDFKDRFDVEIIGSIPDFASAKSKKYGKYYKYNKYNDYYNYYENIGGSK